MINETFFSPFTSGIFAVFAILLGVFLNENKAKVYSSIICVLGILLSFAPLFLFMRKSFFNDTSAIIFTVGLFYQIFLAIITIASIVIFISDKRQEIKRFESYPILTLSFSGMMFAIFSESILGMYLGIELFSIAGYILAGLNRENKTSNEAVVKYFIIGVVSSALMIYGISLIYGFSGGNFDFQNMELSFLNENKLPLTIGFLLFTFGIFFKTSNAPFHFWAPDVYFGMNTPALSFISIAPKLAGFAVLFKITVFNVEHIPFTLDIFYKVISIFAGASMLIGAIGGLRQTSVKKIIAYSGIAHMGFVLCIFSVSYQATMALNVLYYFLIYTFINIGIFGVLAALCKNSRYTGDISDLKGMYKTNPVLSLAFAIFMFSNAGIPPLAGFFAKYSIFAILIKNGSYILPVCGLIASVIASFYYLRIIKNIYFDDSVNKEFEKNANCKINIGIKILILSGVIVNLFFLYI